MQTTTIAITKDAKKRIAEYGLKGESYDKIILRLLKSAEDRLLYDILFNEEGTVTIEEALAEVRGKWQ
jgi:predicted CopG family antitoxin